LAVIVGPEMAKQLGRQAKCMARYRILAATFGALVLGVPSHPVPFRGPPAAGDGPVFQMFISPEG